MYEQCPNGCNAFMLRCESDTDQNIVIYECTGCDWREIEHNPFRIGPWVVSINQAIATIDIVQSLMTSMDTIDFLRPRLKGKSFLSKRGNAWEFTVGDDEYLQGEVNTANQTYLRQMTILVVTYIELILKDFFDSFITTKPLELFKLLAKDNAVKKRMVASISFEKVLSGDAKEAMINNAFSSMTSEDHRRIIRKLTELTPITINWKQILDKLEALTNQRNDIAHNSLYNHDENDQIDSQKIYDDFKLLIGLLFILEKIAQKHSIPYWKDFDYEVDQFIG